MSNPSWIGEHWDKVKNGFLHLAVDQSRYAVDLYNIAFSPGTDTAKTRAINAWNATLNFATGQGANAGGIGSPVFDIPWVKGVSDKLTWLQKTTVNRPLSTVALAIGDSDPMGITGIPTDFGTFTSGDTWRKAWNDSRKVTAGQALTYEGMVGLNLVPPGDPNYDPRKSKQEYYNDWFYRTTSGSLDFALSFVDPLRGAGKLYKLGKLRLIDKGVTEDQIAKGALEQQTFGKHATYGQSFQAAGGQLAPPAQKLYEQARALDEDTFNRLYFNQYAYGGVISTALSGAAKSGRADMFGDVIMAARGSYAATARLTTYQGGAALAEAIGRYRNPYGLANIVMRQADDAAAYEVSNAIGDSAEASVYDQVLLSSPNGTPEFGTLQGTTSAMLGEGTPRVRPNYDAFRIGIHNFSTSGYVPWQVAPMYQRVIDKTARGAVRILTPSHGWGAHLQVNEVGSYRTFRANLERGAQYMDDETRNNYVTAYMAALTANERAHIAGAADNFIVGKMATAHGMTSAEAEQLIRDATARRQNFRNILNSSQRFIPSVFRKRANEVLREGARSEAAVLQDAANRYEEAARNGQVPGYYIRASDDMGHPILVAGEPQMVKNPNWVNPYTPDKGGRLAALPQITEADPILTSMMADRLPMVDYQAFERALGRFAQPRKTIERYRADQERIAAGLEPRYPHITEADYRKAIRDRAVSGIRGAVEDTYEAFNHVWSVAAVLRPAQTLRTLGDDGMRVLTMIGVLPSLTSGSVGLGRIAYNLARRTGMTWGQQREVDRAMRAIEGTTHHEVTVDDVGVPRSHNQRPSESAGHYNYIDPRGTSAPLTIGADEVYPSLEAALNQGRIDLDTYIGFLPWAVRQGRVPHEIQSIIEEWAMGFYGQGAQGRKGLKREVVEYVRDTLGDGAVWTQPRWQQDAADLVNDLARRQHGRQSGGLVFNPLGDEAAFTLDSKAAERYEFVAHKYLDRNPDTAEFDNLDGLYDFANDHAEKLLFGNYKLHAKVASDGRVRFSVVRDMRAPRPLAERMTKEQRQAIARGFKGRGSSGTRIVDGNRTVTIPGVFANMDGDFTKAAVSSQYVPRGFIKGQRNGDRAWQWNRGVDRGDVHPYIEDTDGKRMPNPGWAAEWEHTVNYHLANSEVARRLLEGQDEAQVLHWLDSADPGAMRYMNDRPRLGLSADKHVSMVRAFVDYMAPPEGGQHLRDLILRHEAEGQHIKESVPENLWPTVNGQVTTASLGTHPVMTWASRQIDRYFRVMQDKPMDFLVRYPFVEHKYRSYFEPMYQAYIKQVPGHLVTQTEIDRLARVARQRAIDDTKRYLYDATFRTDLANFLKPMMPFSNAVADAFFKWAKIAYEKPFDTAANWNLVYNFPERAGIVYDQDGNNLQTRDGKEVWISKLDGSVMPEGVQHDKYVAFQPPSWFANKIPGGLKLMTYNKNSMTSAIFDPSINVGPLIALPVNKFALYNPEVGDSQFVKTYVLPFGPTDKESQFLLPGLLGAAKKWYSEDESKASGAAMAIYQTQMTDYRKGLRLTPPTLEDAQEQARHEQALRFFTSVISPVSFQYKSPYQPYIDLYSQLLRKYSGNDDKAMDEFRRTAGDEYIYLAARVTKSNIALPATIKGYKMFKDKQSAIQKYPELASLITGEEGSGSFSKSVYEWEKQQTYDETGKTIRQEQTIADSMADLQRRAGWSDWVKYNAQVMNDLSRRGLKSINAQGAEDIKQGYANWITARSYLPGPNGELEVSPWYKDFRSTDDAAIENRLTQMQQILMEHPDWVKGRSELQGLAQYLDARRQMKSRMNQLGFATLDSQKAAVLQGVWQNQVFGLRLQNNAFDQLYARWLIRDNLAAEGLSASQIVAALEEPYNGNQ